MNKILHSPFPTKSLKFVLYTYSRSQFGLATFQVHNGHMWLVPSYHIGWHRSRFWFPEVWKSERICPKHRTFQRWCHLSVVLKYSIIFSGSRVRYSIQREKHVQKHRSIRKQGMKGVEWWFCLRLSGTGGCLVSNPDSLRAGCVLWTSHSTSPSLRLPIYQMGRLTMPNAYVVLRFKGGGRYNSLTSTWHIVNAQ